MTQIAAISQLLFPIGTILVGLGFAAFVGHAVMLANGDPSPELWATEAGASTCNPAADDRCVDEPLEIGELAYVGIDADRLVAELGDLLLQRCRRLRVNHIVDDDAGTLSR